MDTVVHRREAVQARGIVLGLCMIVASMACSPAPMPPEPTPDAAARATLAVLRPAVDPTAPATTGPAAGVPPTSTAAPATPSPTAVPATPTPVPLPEIETPAGRFRVIRAAVTTFRPFVMGQAPIPAGKQEIQIDLEYVGPTGGQPAIASGVPAPGASPAASPSPAASTTESGAIGAMVQLLPYCTGTVYITTERDDRAHCWRVTTTGLGELSPGTPIGLVFLTSTDVSSLTLVVPDGPAIPLEIVQAADTMATPASPAPAASPSPSPRP